MLQLKFAPLVKNLDFVYWKSGGSKFNFYSEVSDKGKFLEHAIIETFGDQHIAEILKKYDDVHTEQQKTYFTGVSCAKNVYVDEYSYSDFQYG